MLLTTPYLEQEELWPWDLAQCLAFGKIKERQLLVCLCSQLYTRGNRPRGRGDVPKADLDSIRAGWMDIS